ncbi:hypothetical protein [Catenuloplanes indicus]|uniref:Uncharacterized protein n=1 Tax=Catenuloplanes indicus TaxID=137267 RepID=A0AAE4B157_9ACTN|nr:hypothetical protein [Catenuloplanes indicus]MDQ0369301.1 hypothetical protein [Catenuloplanes indicus]
MHPTLAALWIKARQAEMLAEARRTRLATASRRPTARRPAGSLRATGFHRTPSFRRTAGHALVRLGTLIAGEATPRAAAHS